MSTPFARELSPTESTGLYRTSLLRYSPAVLRGIRDHLEIRISARSPLHLARAIEDHLREPACRTAALADLPGEMRVMLSLLPHVPPGGWRLEELRDLLRYLGCTGPEKAIRAMLGLGVLVLHAPTWQVETLRHFDLALNGWEGEQLGVVAHPALGHQLSTPVFESPVSGLTRYVRNVRETDGLEFLLRIAVLWERIATSPLRLTHDSVLFKRDKLRLGSDPVLSSPMFGELAPLSDVGHLALILGKHLQLLLADSDGELLRAQMADVWQESLPLLQRRIWHGLMAARSWTDLDEDPALDRDAHRLPARRWAALLRLASLEPDAWFSLAELDCELRLRDPVRSLDHAPRASRPFQVVVGREGSQSPATGAVASVSPWLEEFLAGAMYQLGVVHCADDAANTGLVVRLSPLGRWLLGVGPQPDAPAVYEKTLFVQPNHEVVVYRQGLTPELVGQLASFCRWKGLGAALTLEVTPENIYRGLEFGRNVEEMISILDRHSQRPVPRAVVDSMRTWSGRRERLRMYKQCTVLEFASGHELDEALSRGIAGDRLTDRLLLVSGEGKIQFSQFRLAGVRDYRQPPAVCVDTIEDGITWEVNLARSDLLVAHELSRFAEPVAQAADDRLRYRITPRSLAAAARRGLRAPYLREWFQQRSGKALPACVELMLQASSRSAIAISRAIVLQTPNAAVADGIMQHPSTRQYIQDRIGPTALVVSPNRYPELQAALREMDVEATGEPME